MTRNGRVLRGICLALFALGLSGCQSPAKVKSYTAKDFHGGIGRLMVVSSVMQFKPGVVPNGMRTSVFETAFRDSLDKCGVEVKFLFQDQLSVIADSEEAVRTFAPDALLSVDERYAEGEHRYSADVIIMATKKIAWRAVIDVSGHAGGDGALAAAIVERLKGDAILSPSCSKP